MSTRTVTPLRRPLARRPVGDEPPGRGQKAARGILGIDAALHRPAVAAHVVLREGQGFAGRDPDHEFDEIEAGDEFGHRMLHLQPRVHFEEVEAAVLAGDEFHRAGRIVADRLGEGDGLRTHRRARRLVEQRRGRFLQNLLIAALDRTLALAEVDHVAVPVPQHLDFDVTRVLDEFLDEDAVVAERRGGLRAGAGKTLLDLGPRRGATRMPLPPPPAEALSITGKPMSAAISTAWAASRMTSRWPGTVETPASRANRFDWILSPMAAMAWGFGPMKVTPASARAVAKASRSERKP